MDKARVYYGRCSGRQCSSDRYCIALRPGHRAPSLAKHVAKDGEFLVNAWVKIDADNKVMAIVPHYKRKKPAFRGDRFY